MKIFVQIASYRDPELEKTIKDMIKNAKEPNNLSIGICRQYHPEDSFGNLSEYRMDKRFRILDVLYSETKGCCWARNQIQQLYDGEEYTLQIDSHMRFEKNWDETLIEMLKEQQKKGFKKPLLSSYAPPFYPETEERESSPVSMWFNRFIPEGSVNINPIYIPDYENLKEPVPARFYSAHFAFTLGKFSTEVQHDPEFYFHGEEISIAVRAFTHGYDLFHPHKVVVWHEYTRKDKIKQWDDDKYWGNKNKISHNKNRQLFGIDNENLNNSSNYGFGKERTLRDYEIYSGILFSKRAVQQYTLDNNYPPNPKKYETNKEWEDSFISHLSFDIYHNLIEEYDYESWIFSLYDEDNKEIYKKNYFYNDIIKIKNDYLHISRDYCKLFIELKINEKPTHWVLITHSISAGCNKITGDLPNEYNKDYDSKLEANSYILDSFYVYK